MLDVLDAILDPMFCERILVTRRIQSIDNTGRTVINTEQLNPVAVVTIGSPEKMAMTTDVEIAKNVITVHSTIRLYDPSTNSYSNVNYQPDLVSYNGNKYLVTKSYNWSRYGNGFFMSECELYNLIEAACDGE